VNKKQEREAIFNKYGSRCSYCGDPLVKGWHVDHMKPVARIREYIPSGHYHKVTKERGFPGADNWKDSDYKWKEARSIPAGMHYPENDTFDNKTPACASCNINKHGMDIEEFRRFILRFINSLNNNSTQYKIAKRYGLIQETNKPVIFWFETYK